MIKISKNAVSSWLQKADELIQEGKTNVYETEALNKILDQIKLKPLYLLFFIFGIIGFGYERISFSLKS